MLFSYLTFEILNSLNCSHCTRPSVMLSTRFKILVSGSTMDLGFFLTCKATNISVEFYKIPGKRTKHIYFLMIHNVKPKSQNFKKLCLQHITPIFFPIWYHLVTCLLGFCGNWFSDVFSAY